MKTRKCALFLFDGYADWEPALAITGLKNYGGFSITSFSANGDVVTSMGGLKIMPEKALDEIEPNEFDLLMLPGGEVWEQGGNKEIIPLLQAFTATDKIIAAICGATVMLASLGILDKIPHTSNGLEYVKQLSPEYKGASFYEEAPCVKAGNIITANGAGMIEFACELYEAFEIADADTLKAVRDLYKSGGMENRLFA
jgi:putative intracellular protease/amidase